MKLAFASVLATALASLAVSVLEFQHFGFDGYYTPVVELNDPDSELCSCKVGDKKTFSGPNAPLNEGVSVHFRGPLVLHNFAAYVSDGFVSGEDSSGDWKQIASYDGKETKNATFSTSAGKNSSCLGPALTYADSDGISKADKATVLKADTKIKSNKEYAIFSGEKCGDSGVNGDCGVYRKGIPAYHGFDGAVKMFLFEFEMPEDKDGDKDLVPNFNMPAIWLLNAQIPRTAQYSFNSEYVNCSCWRLGCGEFDVFEIMNSTDSGKLVLTIHDYQNTDNIETGLVAPGFIDRSTKGKMAGGVLFDKNGDVVVFVSDSTSFDESLPASTVNGWIKKAGTAAVNDLNATKTGDDSLSSGKKNLGSLALISLAAIFGLMMAWTI